MTNHHRTAAEAVKSEKPFALAPLLDNIPRALRELPRWICWKHMWHKEREKWIKLPIDANTGRAAKTTSESSWTDFDTARSRFELIGGVDGLGFVFNGDGVVGGDFDKCLDPTTGQLSDAARAAVNGIEGYWELSPSGKGLHFITWAMLDKAYKDDKQGIELYATGRYFTVTGQVFDDKARLSNVPQDLQWLIDKHFPAKEATVPAKVGPQAEGTFFQRVNAAAMQSFGSWVPSLFPTAREHGDGYRVSSVDLGRDLEEDLAIHPTGIVDFGVHDMGDAREGKRSALDLVMGHAPEDVTNLQSAALWLCRQMSIEPESLGYLNGNTNLDFSVSKSGAILPTLRNVSLALGNPSFSGFDLRFDDFRSEIVFAPAGTQEFRPFADEHAVQLRILLERKGFSAAKAEHMRDAALHVAKQNTFDTAQLWLNSLKWDGVSRVERFMCDYFGTEDTPYAQAVSLYVWTALAGRVLEPGCQADMVPILIGAQGAGKSSGVRAISPAPEFYIELTFAAIDHNDTSRKLRGTLVGEIPELQGLQTKELEAIKAWVTKREETFVEKYKSYAETFPRRVLFFGTTNEPAFLADETGNRRWLPVTVGKVDVSAIIRDRAQLWAEGAVLFTAEGIAWRGAEVIAPEIHEAHRVVDDWETRIATWLELERGGWRGDNDSPLPKWRETEFTGFDVQTDALNLQPAQISKATQMRVGRILTSFGFVRKVASKGGKNARVWVLGPIQAAA